ncbi:MAG: hypothetical protein D6721_09000 [Gammaproteobacteria bacterium]|nr:MAG: hypothetical protein D6721_09000 [Gammaproteobacteria bacterium]
MTVEGTYEELTSGFLKLTVSSASGANAPHVGDAAYALNVPGYVFILKPMDPGSDQIIPMVKSGSCPTSNLSANWVTVTAERGMNASDSNQDFYGTFTFDPASSQASLPSRYNFDQTDLGSLSLPPGSCNEGVLTLTGADMFLTDNGGAIVHLGVDTPSDPSDDQIIFGFAQQSIGDVANLAGDYAGLAFDGNRTSGTGIFPVSITCDNAGNCTGKGIVDIDTNTLTNESVDITLSTADNPSTGFITGTVIDTNQPGSTPGKLGCVVNLNAQGSGKNIISCVGQSPGDNTKIFNILFISK